MDKNIFEDKNVRVAIVSAMVIGILFGLSIADIVFDDYQTGLPDSDNDGVPDASDLDPDGDAGIRFTLVEVIHPELEEEANVTLIPYFANGLLYLILRPSLLTSILSISDLKIT